MKEHYLLMSTPMVQALLDGRKTQTRRIGKRYANWKKGDRIWGKSNWVNPPFRAKDAINGHGPTAFVREAIRQQSLGKSSVIIVPVQSYVNMLIEAGAKCRPAGRVKWLEVDTGKPYKTPGTCSIFILRGAKC